MEPKVATFEGPLQAMMANYYWAINGPLVVFLLGSTRKNYKTGTEKRDETRKRDLKITATDPKQTRFLIQLPQATVINLQVYFFLYLQHKSLQTCNLI
jgi:hypothetical protein